MSNERVDLRVVKAIVNGFKYEKTKLLFSIFLCYTYFITLCLLGSVNEPMPSLDIIKCGAMLGVSSGICIFIIVSVVNELFPRKAKNRIQ